MASLTDFNIRNNYYAGQDDRRARELLEAQERRVGEQHKLNTQNTRLAIEERERQASAESFQRAMLAVSRSPDPLRTYQTVTRTPRFQQDLATLGLPQDQFAFDPNDNPDQLRQSAATWVGQGQGTGEPAALQTFNAMTEGFSPEDIEKARRIQLGLEGRAGQDIGRINEIELPDGQKMQIVYNQSTNSWQPLADLGQQPGMGSPASAVSPTGISRSPEQAEEAKLRMENRVEGELAEPQRQEALRAAIIQVDANLANIDRALGAVDEPWSTGTFAQLTSKIKRTPAGQLEGLLRPVRAALAFDRLQQMRDASKTGGALGQVSNVELALLEGSVAALDVGYGAEYLADALQRVRAHYENWKLMQLYEGQEPVTNDWLPTGYKYYDEDEGKFYEYTGGDKNKESSWRAL